MNGRYESRIIPVNKRIKNEKFESGIKSEKEQIWTKRYIAEIIWKKEWKVPISNYIEKGMKGINTEPYWKRNKTGWKQYKSGIFSKETNNFCKTDLVIWIIHSTRKSISRCYRVNMFKIHKLMWIKHDPCLINHFNYL